MLKTHVLASSHDGRPIDIFELENNGPAILIICGMHGDEPQSAFFGQCIVDLLHTKVGGMMDEHLIIIPNLNPDGHARGSRKNAHGVDLNRNFPAANWKRTPPEDEYHGGPMAGSEPETQLVLDLIRRYQPQRILSIHCIDGGRQCVNYDGPAEQLAAVMAQENGYEVRADIGHPTPGSLGAWSGHERQIPMVTLELPAEEDGETSWRQNRDAIMNFIQVEFDR